MSGMITEKNWDEINEAYPGIEEFYESLAGERPNTFLELEWMFLNRVDEPRIGENL